VYPTFVGSESRTEADTHHQKGNREGNRQMSEYRQLNRAFWDSEYVEEELDTEGTLIYLYLIAGEKSNMEGLYRVSLSRIGRHTKTDRETVQRWLRRLERDKRAGWLNGWACVTQAVRHMPQSPQMLTHARELYDTVPDDVLAWALSIGYQLPRGLESIRYRYRMDTVLHRQTDIQTNPVESDTVSIRYPNRGEEDVPDLAEHLREALPWKAAGGGKG
jgi:hypothetical protein